MATEGDIVGHLCEGCGYAAKSGAGLAAHRRACASKASPTSRTTEAASSGDRATTLMAQAVRLAQAVDVCESDRDLPSLSRELRLIMAELDGLGVQDAEDAVDRLVSADELASRRARIAKTAG